MTRELLEFTRDALARGRDRTDIAATLRRAEWHEADIKAALTGFADIDYPIPVPRPRPYLSAKEVFLYLLLFTALYATAWHLGDLAFDLINRGIPDATVASRSSGTDSIRRNSAVLIVFFPVFLTLFVWINRRITIDPTRRASRPRKWLTYLTLFGTAVTLLVDAAALVHKYLGGELTLRIGLKLAVVAAISSVILGYFLREMRKDEAEEG